jgi:hypothetical protein
MDTETDIIFNRISTLINDIPGHTHQDKLNHLSQCNCCSKHKINKPRVFMPCNESSAVYTPDVLVSFTQREQVCSCICRHLARQICRRFEPSDVYISLTPPNSP